MTHPDGAECEALSLATTGTVATAAVDFREGALQEHVFLVIHNVHTCPVDCNNHLVLGQTWSREPANYHYHVSTNFNSVPLWASIHTARIFFFSLIMCAFILFTLKKNFFYGILTTSLKQDTGHALSTGLHSD